MHGPDTATSADDLAHVSLGSAGASFKSALSAANCFGTRAVSALALASLVGVGLGCRQEARISEHEVSEAHGTLYLTPEGFVRCDIGNASLDLKPGQSEVLHSGTNWVVVGVTSQSGVGRNNSSVQVHCDGPGMASSLHYTLSQQGTNFEAVNIPFGTNTVSPSSMFAFLRSDGQVDLYGPDGRKELVVRDTELPLEVAGRVLHFNLHEEAWRHFGQHATPLRLRWQEVGQAQERGVIDFHANAGAAQKSHLMRISLKGSR